MINILFSCNSACDYLYQGLIDLRSGERACNSAHACRDGKMLVVTKPNAWAGGKGSYAVCVDLQAVGALKFFDELYSLAKGFGPFLSGVWAGFREREDSIFSNHQHFAVSTGMCGVACPLPALRVEKPLPIPIALISASLLSCLYGQITSPN